MGEMTEKEAISIIEAVRPGCGEKPIYPEGELWNVKLSEMFSTTRNY